MTKVKIYPSEGYGAHIRSVEELAEQVNTLEEGLIASESLVEYQESNKRSFNFPFQADATFYSSSTGGYLPEIRGLVRFLKLYGADSTHQYCLETIRRLPNTPQWLFNVMDRTTGVVVCNLNTNVSPEGQYVTDLAETNDSGVTGQCVLDWSAIGEVQIQGIQTFERSGFSADVYTGNISQSYVESFAPEVDILEIPKIYATLNNEVSMYFDNVIKTVNLDNYDIQMSGAGTMNSLRWYFTPTVLQDESITLRISNKTDGTLLKSLTIPIIVTDDDNDSDAVKTVVCIGDSITNYMTHIEVCRDKFEHTDTSAGIEFIGSIGTDPIVSEGYGGWRASTFLGAASNNGFTNQFWNPATSEFDFSYYISNTGYDVPTDVIIALGTNDCYGFTPAAFLTNLQEMIASIQAYSGSIRIAISLVVPPSLAGDVYKDGFAMTNTNWGLYDRYYATFEYNQLLIETYGDESLGITLLPANINLDRRNNFEKTTVVTGDRLANSYTVSGDTTHPLIEGRRQMGDSYYYFLKSL